MPSSSSTDILVLLEYNIADCDMLSRTAMSIRHGTFITAPLVSSLETGLVRQRCAFRQSLTVGIDFLYCFSHVSRLLANRVLSLFVNCLFPKAFHVRPHVCRGVEE
jgi:hypothetical protein